MPLGLQRIILRAEIKKQKRSDDAIHKCMCYTLYKWQCSTFVYTNITTNTSQCLAVWQYHSYGITRYRDFWATLKSYGTIVIYIWCLLLNEMLLCDAVIAFVSFPISLLLSISSFMTLCLRKILDMISIFLTFLRHFCDLTYDLSWKMIYVCWRRMCILLLLENVYSIYVN